MAKDDPLEAVWEKGYTVSELWASEGPPPVHKATSEVEADHVPDWGLLGEIEYSKGYGAGNRYLAEHWRAGDWVALGYEAPRKRGSLLVKLPYVADAKFGTTHSSVYGDGFSFVGVRFLHASLLSEATLAFRRAGRPSSEKAIVNAYVRAKAENLVQAGAPLAKRIQATQAIIRRDHIDQADPLKGFKKEAVAKVLRKISD